MKICWFKITCIATLVLHTYLSRKTQAIWFYSFVIILMNPVMFPLYPNVLINWPGVPMSSLRRVHLYISDSIYQLLWNYHLSFSVVSKTTHNHLKKTTKILLSSSVTFSHKAELSSYILINTFLNRLSREADLWIQLSFVKSSIKGSCIIVKQYKRSH